VAVGRRWPTKLHSLDHDRTQDGVYLHAVRPGVIFEAGSHTGGYQGIRMVVEPRRQALLYPEGEGRFEPEVREPLPFLI
jgi:hypothetical protein